MQASSQGIIDAALKLPEPERAHVVQELIESLSPDSETMMDDAWAAELDRRLAEFERGEGAK
ncbi:MAG: addiction module protein [Planctomycetes bacterium]|nr:addiction module protein [Planctomycetota bacterium]MBL7038238.1 addiction module protein [Pirellulaceae bacterium]